MEIIRYVNEALIEEFKKEKIDLWEFIKLSCYKTYADGNINIPIKIIIPDTDKDKMNELLLDQLYRFEGIMGKYNCQYDGLKCEFQTAFHRLIRAEIGVLKGKAENINQQINKVLNGKE